MIINIVWWRRSICPSQEFYDHKVYMAPLLHRVINFQVSRMFGIIAFTVKAESNKFDSNCHLLCTFWKESFNSVIGG